MWLLVRSYGIEGMEDRWLSVRDIAARITRPPITTTGTREVARLLTVRRKENEFETRRGVGLKAAAFYLDRRLFRVDGCRREDSIPEYSDQRGATEHETGGG